MSSVRMCDRDGTIFSERADGWSTQSGTIMQKDEHGQMRQVQAQLDLCPECTTLAMAPPPRPELPLGTDVRGEYTQGHLEP